MIQIENLQIEFNKNISLLTKIAIKERWCIKEDHCIRRIIYDFLFKDDWRNHCIKKPVYKHLTEEQLNKGLELIIRLHTCNKEYVALLNYASLKWRNKI